jgi:hypothetical protein
MQTKKPTGQQFLVRLLLLLPGPILTSPTGPLSPSPTGSQIHSHAHRQGLDHARLRQSGFQRNLTQAKCRRRRWGGRSSEAWACGCGVPANWSANPWRTRDAACSKEREAQAHSHRGTDPAQHGSRAPFFCSSIYKLRWAFPIVCEIGIATCKISCLWTFSAETCVTLF